MAAQRAAEDPDITHFEATVEAVDGADVQLDETYFYAESGGQPADRGTIDGVAVLDVQPTSDGVVHTLAEQPTYAPGTTVTGEIDIAFRTYCRRAHSASHVIYGAARQHLADLGYGGFDIGERKVRIDFETSSDIDDDTLLALERASNRVVWESRPVTWEQIPLDTVHQQPGIAFNTKTEEGVFGTEDTVRVVEIGTSAHIETNDWWDRAACGGTHVRNTHEIGPIAVLDRSNPGEGLTRIELTVGERAIDHFATLRNVATEAANVLESSVDDLPERATQIAEEVQRLEDTTRLFQDQLIEARVGALPLNEKDDATWVVGAIADADGEALGRFIRERENEDVDVIALVSTERPVQLVVGSDGSMSASDIVTDVTETFGGGGGGADDFAQGGGIDADPEDIVAYLRE